MKTDSSVMLSKLAEQLSVIFSLDDSSDVVPKINQEDVMYVINEVIKRASLL
jgi:hypothetical protein